MCGEQTWNAREGVERETGFNCSSSSIMRREICLLMSAKKTSSSSSISIAVYILVFLTLCKSCVISLLEVEFEGMLKESNI